MSKVTELQPPPSYGSIDVTQYVLLDVEERSNFGLQKYGTKLKTKNGRDSLWDAYQEALDLVFYLRKEILEREGD
jgi:hypothetical protein